MKILLNDESRELAPGASLASLLEALNLASHRGLAVAINGAVIPRSAWPSHTLQEGNEVLVIRATQGG